MFRKELKSFKINLKTINIDIPTIQEKTTINKVEVNAISKFQPSFFSIKKTVITAIATVITIPTSNT